MKRKSRGQVRVIASLPPYASHRDYIIGHPLVSGLRFNTIWDPSVPRSELLARLQRECGSKPLWVDLKARQLRVAEYGVVPFAFVRIMQRITVDLPVEIHFHDRTHEYTAQVVEIIDGNQLIFDRVPRITVGRGQAMNITHPSLKIEGFLIDNDREYVAAAMQLGLHNYMLSFYELLADSEEVRALDPAARVVAKIESRRGMEFMRQVWRQLPPEQRPRLMAARDDLWIHHREAPADFLPAVEDIVRADRDAIVASRLLTSLEDSTRVTPHDLSDLELMLRFGYRTIMLSDGLCLDRVAFLRAMSVLERVLGDGGRS